MIVGTVALPREEPFVILSELALLLVFHLRWCIADVLAECSECGNVLVIVPTLLEDGCVLLFALVLLQVTE